MCISPLVATVLLLHSGHRISALECVCVCVSIDLCMCICDKTKYFVRIKIYFSLFFIYFIIWILVAHCGICVCVCSRLLSIFVCHRSKQGCSFPTFGPGNACLLIRLLVKRLFIWFGMGESICDGFGRRFAFFVSSAQSSK